MIRTVSKALAHKRSALGQKEKGFTLIELLVVVIIIGILAAVAIPIFLGQQASARDSAVKADIANAKTAVVAAMVSSTTGAVPTLAEAKVNPVPSNLTLTSTAATATVPAVFCIEGFDTTNAVDYKATDSTGVIKGSC